MRICEPTSSNPTFDLQHFLVRSVSNWVSRFRPIPFLFHVSNGPSGRVNFHLLQLAVAPAGDATNSAFERPHKVGYFLLSVVQHSEGARSVVSATLPIATFAIFHHIKHLLPLLVQHLREKLSDRLNFLYSFRLLLKFVYSFVMEIRHSYLWLHFWLKLKPLAEKLDYGQSYSWMKEVP